MLKFNKFTSLLLCGPSFAGTIIGGSYSGYNTYQDTKHYNFVSNFSQVVASSIAGSAYGFIGGTFWFVGLPILISRNYEGISFDGKDIFKIYKK